MFTGLSNGVSGLTGTSVTVTVSTGATALVRNVTVNYSTSVNTLFGAVIGMSALHMSGSSTASAQIPPNIDFYVLLDNSPSMALPATTAGVTQMQTLTSKQDSGGCAFACHQASTNNGDTAGNPCADGTAPNQSSGLYCDVTKHGAQIDNYALARKNNITLRLDELNSGVTTLLQTASTTAKSSQFATPPNYRFSVYSMDSLWQIGLTQLMPLTTNYVSQWSTASANFGVMEMYSNNNDCANAACSSGTTTPGGDVATNYDDSLGKLSQTSYIPNPGNGTNQPGDTPQEVLFIVTDGVEDEQNGGRLQQAINDLGNAPGGNSSSEPTGARRSRTAASRSRSSTPTTCRSPQTAGTKPTLRRSSPTSARRFRPAPRRACSTTRRSAPTSARRSRRCSPRPPRPATSRSSHRGSPTPQ